VDGIDLALRRPGCFDSEIEVTAPTMDERLKILEGTVVMFSCKYVFSLLGLLLLLQFVGYLALKWLIAKGWMFLYEEIERLIQLRQMSGMCWS